MAPRIIRTPASPVLVRAHKCQSGPLRTSPLTVQNARKMGAVRTSGIADLLETYKKTQKSTLDAQRTNQGDGKEQAQRKDEPDVPQAARGSAPPLLTMQERELQDAKEQEAERKLGVDRFRVRKHVCPNPECQDPTAQPEVDADGNSVCPSCGQSDENAAPEFEGAGQQDISDLEGGNRRTFLQDGGADNRTGQEWQDDANRDLYVIEARDVPNATEAQRWWANNRMNQAMVWADYMGADRGLPDGFAISYDEIERIKRTLRAVCIAVAPHAPDDDVENEEDEDFAFGSPLLWTVLLTLEMIAQRQQGFVVATETMQATATVRALHAYMRKFQSAQAKRYVEMLGAFRTRAKGVDAKLAQQNLDRVKVRQAAWHSLGTDPTKLAAKVATLDRLLKMSRAFGQTDQGESIGLSGPVMRGEQPGLSMAPNQISRVQDLARNKGTFQPLLVDRAKEKAKGINFFKQKEWDRADTSLLKRDRKAPQGARGADAAAQEEEEEDILGVGDDDDSDDDDSEDDEFSGLMLTKQERRIMRQKRNELVPLPDAQQQPQPQQQQQQPTQDLSRLTDEPSDPMDEDASSEPGPTPPASAGGSSGGGGGGGGGGASSSSDATSDVPNPQLASFSDDDLEVEIAKQLSTIDQVQQAGNADAESLELQDQLLREMQAELQRRRDVAQRKQQPAPAPPQPHTSLDEFDVDVFAEYDDNADGGGGGGDNVDAGPGPARNSDVVPSPAVVNSEGVITELPGMEGDDDEEGITDRALLLLSLDLSPEAFAQQQEQQMEQMREEMAERAEQLKRQVVEEAEARAAAQEAKEALYRQDGVYDRHKDIRNNMDEGVKEPTPSYAELLQGGRKVRPEYKGIRVIRALTYAEVVESRNYHKKGYEFVREWQKAQREWRAEQAAKLEKMQNAEAIKEASRQKRLAEAAQRQIEREAEEERLEAGRRRAEENRFRKSDKQMVANQRQAKGKYTINKRESNPLLTVIRKAENSNMLLKLPSVEDGKEEQGKQQAEQPAEQQLEEEKEYEYNCAKCQRLRVVKDTKPKPGWECSDGGYACKRRYSCKNCPRTFYKEGEPSDEYECKDVGKDCLPDKKKRRS